MIITAQEVNQLRKKTGAGMMDCKNALSQAAGDFELATDILRKKASELFSNRSERDTNEGAVFTKINDTDSEAIMIVLNCETDFLAKNASFQALGAAILAVAFHNKPSTLDDLYQLTIDGVTVYDTILSFIGTVREKITIGAYELLQGEVVVPYIHTGSTLGVLVSLKGARGQNVIDAGRDVAMQIAAIDPVAVDKDGIDTATIEKELAIAREQSASEGKPEAILEKVAQEKLNKLFQKHTLLQQAFVKNNKVTIAQYLQSIAKGLTVTDFKRMSVSG